MQVNELTACCNPAKAGIEAQAFTLCFSGWRSIRRSPLFLYDSSTESYERRALYYPRNSILHLTCPGCEHSFTSDQLAVGKIYHVGVSCEGYPAAPVTSIEFAHKSERLSVHKFRVLSDTLTANDALSRPILPHLPEDNLTKLPAFMHALRLVDGEHLLEVAGEALPDSHG